MSAEDRRIGTVPSGRRRQPRTGRRAGALLLGLVLAVGCSAPSAPAKPATTAVTSPEVPAASAPTAPAPAPAATAPPGPAHVRVASQFAATDVGHYIAVE